MVDTIVSEVQSVPGEDRCVLLLGYEDEMRALFQNSNPGLSRRFPISNAFHFKDFDDDELLQILTLKLKQQDLGASAKAMEVAIRVLSRARNGLNFGNGGEVENLLGRAKSNYESRKPKQVTTEAPALHTLQGVKTALGFGSTVKAPTIATDFAAADYIFEPEDFDPDWDRMSVKAGINLQDLFKGVLGCDAMIDKLKGYIDVAKGMRAQDLDPFGEIPMNFVFKGPPGRLSICPKRQTAYNL